MSRKFQLVSDYSPQGDQPEAISKIHQGYLEGKNVQTLLGVTFWRKITMGKYLSKSTMLLGYLSNKKTCSTACNGLEGFFPLMQ